jgi:dephospho-CoA kinase
LKETNSREQVLKRINAQWTDEQRISKVILLLMNVDVEIAKRKTEEILKNFEDKQRSLKC